MRRNFYRFLHHQGEHADIVVGLVVVVPVVAVQAGIVEIAEVEAVAVRVAGLCQAPSEALSLDYFSGLYRIPRRKRVSVWHGVEKGFSIPCDALTQRKFAALF